MATMDPEVIRQTWSDAGIVIGFTKDGREVPSNPNFNIGVASGQGLFVLDVDRKNGVDGAASLKEIGVTKLEGLVVKTPHGGLHAYYRGPDVTNSVGKLGPGLDSRSRGGYVVGPGSVVDGVAYEIVRDGELAPVPSAIVHRLVTPPEKRPQQVGFVADSPAAVDRAIDYLTTQAPLAVEGAGGDNTTFRVAAHLKDIGVSQDLAVQLMAEHWNDRCSPPWNIQDLRTKVANAFEYGMRPLGDLSPEADFVGVKIEPPPGDLKAAASPTVLMWAENLDHLPSMAMLVKPYLPMVGVAMLYSAPKVGKTFIAQHLAVALTTGEQFAGHDVREKAGGALLLLGEGLGTVVTRMQAARRHAGLAPNDALHVVWTPVSHLIKREAWLHDTVGQAAAAMEARGRRLALVVVDTFASAMGVDDENASSEITQAMQVLERVALAFKLLVLVNGHEGKSGNGPRGSSAFSAAVDVLLHASRIEGDERRTFEVVMNRNGPEGLRWSFELARVVIGQDADGDIVESRVVTWSSDREMTEADQLIDAALREALADYPDEIDGRSGVMLQNAATALSRFIDAGPEAARKRIERFLARYGSGRPWIRRQVGRRVLISLAIGRSGPQQDFAGVNISPATQ